MAEMSTMAPDTTWQRYQIDNFKNTSEKRVPYEELDFNIYSPKSNRVAFSTTEKRLPLWIKALHLRYNKDGLNNNPEIHTRWLEQEITNCSYKCDKITINIQLNNTNVLSITVNVDTGRIQAQGRLVKEWGTKEFKHLLTMVNAQEETWNTDSIKPFIETILGKEKSSAIRQSQSCTQPEDSQSVEHITPNTSATPRFL